MIDDWNTLAGPGGYGPESGCIAPAQPRQAQRSQPRPKSITPRI